MIYFPGTINTVSTRLYCHIIYISNEFTSPLPAVHVNLLCACWHSEAVKGSSSLSSRRLLISLWVTSLLFLCPELTDAPYPYYGARSPFSQNGALIHRVRTHSLSRVQDSGIIFKKHISNKYTVGPVAEKKPSRTQAYNLREIFIWFLKYKFFQRK